MSTIACPRCHSVFPLSQVAQFDQFTCGSCGAIIPVPIAKPSAIPPARAARPAAPPPTVAIQPGAIRAQPKPAAPAPAPIPTPAPKPAAQAPRPAAPAPQPARAQAAPAAARPAAPAPARPATPAPAAPSRRAAALPVPALEPMDDDEGADESPRRGGRRGRDGGGRDEKKKPPMALLAGAGVVVAIIAVVLFFKSRSPGDAATAAAGGNTGDANTPQLVKAAADPDQDPAAWKALPEADRKLRAQMKASSVDPKQEVLSRATYEFLKVRDEKDAAMQVAREVSKARPELDWPHIELGHADLREITDACLKECEWSDSLGTEAHKELTRLRKKEAPERGAWWGDEALQTRVKELIAQVRQEETTLGTKHGQAVAKWVAYRKSVDGMRDFPAIHGTSGPYLVFVSLPKPPEGPDKKRSESLADVKPEDLARGKEILESTLKLYTAFYDGWHEIMGPIFGLKRYGPDNVDQESMLLVNVFTSAADYAAYGAPPGARAYYSIQEPRFITTYEGPRQGGESDPDEDTAHVQCHEGTHQLVHFYTWDTSRKKAQGGRLEWLSCHARRMWSQEGFAEFFSAYRKDGDKYVWMQPLDGRLADMWIFREIMKERKWDDWKLREVLDVVGNLQMQAVAQSRLRTGDNPGLVNSLMANLFYARAWSLNYFLWYAEENGKPKYRDRFIQYIKSEFDMTLTRDASGRETGKERTANDLKKAIGITDDAAFDTEWRAFESNLIEKHKSPKWEERRARLRKNLGLDGAKPGPGK